MKTKKTSTRLTKILALVLSLLMLLGAMPVALAATPVNPTIVEQPTFDRTVMMYGETFSALKIIGGKADVPGEFIFAAPTAFIQKTGTGFKVPLRFVPEDTVNYNTITVIPPTTVDVVQSTAARIEGTLSVNPLQVGQTLSQAEFVKSADFAMMNFNTKQNCTINWENPDKIMDKAGEYQEKVIISSDKGDDLIKPIEMMITVNVIGGEDIINIAELPTASDITLGKTLADSILTGGRVTKGGKDIPGTFAWKDPSIAMTAQGTAEYDVVFTPDDPTVCEPVEMQVSVTVGKSMPEIIEWPAIKAEYKYGQRVADCVTLEGGEASVPGYFNLEMNDVYYSKVPETINETVEISVRFSPKDSSNYQDIRDHKVTVKFEPADPDCFLTYVVANSKTFIFDCNIRTRSNWPQHTGHFYIVVDGERTELTEYNNKVSYDCDNIAVGEHYVYAEYVPGENDVYTYGRSNNEFTINVEGFYDVTVTDFEGTRVVANHKAGQEVIVQAANHEKEYYDFSGWTVEGTPLPEGTDTTQQRMVFTMPDGEVQLTANYKLNFKLALKTFFNDLASWFMDAIAPLVEFIRGLIPQK